MPTISPAGTSRLGLGETLIATYTLPVSADDTCAMPGRLTHSARKFTLHLPTRWPWARAPKASLVNLRSVVVLT